MCVNNHTRVAVDEGGCVCTCAGLCSRGECAQLQTTVGKCTTTPPSPKTAPSAT